MLTDELKRLTAEANSRSFEDKLEEWATEKLYVYTKEYFIQELKEEAKKGRNEYSRRWCISWDVHSQKRDLELTKKDFYEWKKIKRGIIFKSEDTVCFPNDNNLKMLKQLLKEYIEKCFVNTGLEIDSVYSKLVMDEWGTSPLYVECGFKIKW